MQETTSFPYKKLLFFVITLVTIFSTSVSFSQEVKDRNGNGIIEESDYLSASDKYSKEYIQEYNANLDKIYNATSGNNSNNSELFDTTNRMPIGSCNLITCGSFDEDDISSGTFKTAVGGTNGRYIRNVAYTCWDDNGTVDWSEGQYISYSNSDANIDTPGIIQQSNLDGGPFSIFSYENESINQDIIVQPNTVYTVCFEIAVIPRYSNNDGDYVEYQPNLEFGIDSGGIVISDPLTYTHSDLNVHPASDFPPKLTTATSGNGGFQNPGGWTEINPYWENVCITFKTDNSGTVNVFYATGDPGRSVVLVDGLRLSIEGYANPPELSTDNASLCINSPVDLDDYVLAQDIPTGAELKWSTNSDPSVIADHLTNTTVTPPGTWYAFFYHPGFTCFSPVSTLELSSSDLDSSYTQENVTCYGDSDGSIDLTVTDGASPYTYLWTTGDGSGLDDDAADQTGLTAGTYNVTVTDDNGCTTSESVTITSPPNNPITVNCPANVTVDCNDDIAGDYATWYGSFSSSGGTNTQEILTATVDGISIPIGDLVAPTDICAGTIIIVTLSATDDCNQDESCSSTFTLSADTTPPTASNLDPITVECIDDVPDPDITLVDDEDDNCSTPTVTHQGDVSNDVPCEPTITRTYRVTDSCGLFTDVTQIINIDLTTAPVVDPSTGGSTVECEANAAAPQLPTIVDSCDNLITPTGGLTTEGNYDGCEGTIIYRYTYTDCADNSTDYVYTYTIDYTGGITAPADDTLTVECVDEATLPTAPASVDDSCGNEVVPVYVGVTSTPDPITCEGTVEYKWSYTDCTGAVVDYYTYTYTIDLTTAPVVNPSSGSDTVECEANAVAPQLPTIVDTCDNLITPSGGLTTEGNYDGCEGTIIYRYTYTDCASNSTDYVYTYTVDYTGGITAPTDDTETVECVDEATLPTAPASVDDSCGNEVVPVYVGVTSTPDPITCEGTVEYKWSYTDCTGAVVDYYTYTYTIDLTTAPVVNPSSGSDTVECEANAVAPQLPTIVDTCDNLITPSGGLTTEGNYDGCEGTIVYRYTYTDCASNSTDYVYTYTVDYTGGITAPTDDTETVECVDEATLPTAPASVDDSCGNEVVPVYVGVTSTPDPITCEGTVEYKWSYTDCTGAVVDYYTYTYTIDLTTAPVVNPSSGSDTVECEANAVAPQLPTIVDTCDNLITPSGGLTTEGNYDGCEGTIVYRYTYTDCANNSTDYVYTYTVDYTGGITAPTDDTETVECVDEATLPTAPASIDDSCGNAVVPVYVGVTSTPDPITCEGTVEYKWSYTDCTGAVVDYYTYTYTIDLTTAPVVNPSSGSDTVECEANAVAPQLPTIVDTCDNLITPSGGLTTEGNYDGCEGTIVYRYTYTDCASNSTDYVYTYTVDYTGGITAPTDDTQTVECVDDATLPTAPASVDDSCGNEVVPVYVGVTSTPDPITCEGTVEYKWSYTDCTGDVVDYYTYTYTIDLTTAPVVNPSTGSDTVSCVSEAVAPQLPTIVDSCDNAITPTGGLTQEGTYDDCEGTIVYRYTYTDCANNSTDYVFTYNVELTIGDAPDPGNDGSATVECEADAVAPQLPVVTDACDNAITPTGGITEEGTYDGCEGTIIYRYTFTDCAGNDTDWLFTYNVDLTTDPEVPADGSATVECEADAVAPQLPVVTDACDNAITPTGGITEEGTYDGCEGTIIYRYTFTDCAGNDTDWLFTYNVDLTTDPEVPADGSDTVECEADAVAPELPTVMDACDNEIQATGGITEEGTYDGCEGTIIYRYTFTDCAGNDTDWLFTYNVDLTTDPEVPADGSDTVECEADAVAPELPTVMDACDNEIQATGGITEEGTYDGCEGTIIYRYTFTDCAGNDTDWLFTYNVDLTTDPEVPADGSDTVECEADAVAPELPTVMDACDNEIQATGGITEEGTYDGCEGTIIYRYTFTDCAGNDTDWLFTYTIDVVDFEMPEDVVHQESIACETEALEPTPPQVNDNCGNSIVPTGPIQGGTYEDCEGTITYTWNYEDCSGNNHDWVYTYTVEVLDFEMPEDEGSIIACETEAIEPIPPMVNDNCGNPIQPTGPILSGTFDGFEGTIIYTWTYTDCVGNSHDWVYTYTVEALVFEITSQVNELCFGDANGSVDITVSGGTPDYPYFWTTIDGSGLVPDAEDQTGLTAGTYEVLITDANGCSITETVIIEGPQSPLSITITSQVDVLCYGDANGEINISVSGGTPDYIYLWSNGQPTQDLFNLNPGTYTVVVTDANGCTATASATVAGPDEELTSEITSQTDVLCYGDASGEIDLTVNGGTPDYTYLWTTTDGSGLVITAEDQTGLTAGTYEVLVTDENGCTTTNSVTITEPQSGLDATIISQVNIECTGLGSVTIEVNGGTLPYEYTLNGGTTQNSGIFNDLTEGDNTILITDANGCTFTIPVFIENECIALIKEVELIDENGNDCADEGEVLHYTFTVNNMGNVELTDVTITDPLVTVNGGPIALLPGEIDATTFTADYIITENDAVNVGQVENQATVFGTTPIGDVITDLSDDNSFLEDDPTIFTNFCVVTVDAPTIALIKEAIIVDENDNGCPEVGETILYTFQVKNTSADEALTDVIVSDPMVAVLGGPINLAIDEINTDAFTAIYTITQEDFDNGYIENQATAEGTGVETGLVATDLSHDSSFLEDGSTWVDFCAPAPPVWSLVLEKSGEWNDEDQDGNSDVGESISYTFSVTNNGDEPIYNITIEDPLPGLIIEGGPIAVLMPLETDDTTFTAIYYITQDDIDNGFVINQATVTGEDEFGDEIVSDESDDPDTEEPNDPTVVDLPGVGGADWEIFNGITPNGDGYNDYFQINGIDMYPNNNVRIFNRWGILIFEANGYNESSNVFTGESNARVTIEGNRDVPTGTYFYVITFSGENPGKNSYSGYLYLNR